MGKLTAEQKVREYNRGQKAAREGRSRSWSEPWAYPFESDQHYEENRFAERTPQHIEMPRHGGIRDQMHARLDDRLAATLGRESSLDGCQNLVIGERKRFDIERIQVVQVDRRHGAD